MSFINVTVTACGCNTFLYPYLLSPSILVLHSSSPIVWSPHSYIPLCGWSLLTSCSAAGGVTEGCLYQTLLLTVIMKHECDGGSKREAKQTKVLSPLFHVTGLQHRVVNTFLYWPYYRVTEPKMASNPACTPLIYRGLFQAVHHISKNRTWCFWHVSST